MLVSSVRARKPHLSRCVEEGRAGPWKCWPGCILQAHGRSPGSVQAGDWQHHWDSRSLYRGHRLQAQAACAVLWLWRREGYLHTVQQVLIPCQRAVPGFTSSSRQGFGYKADDIPGGAACQARLSPAWQLLAVPWFPTNLSALLCMKTALSPPASGSPSLHKES